MQLCQCQKHAIASFVLPCECQHRAVARLHEVSCNPANAKIARSHDCTKFRATLRMQNAQCHTYLHATVRMPIAHRRKNASSFVQSRECQNRACARLHEVSCNPANAKSARSQDCTKFRATLRTQNAEYYAAVPVPTARDRKNAQSFVQPRECQNRAFARLHEVSCNIANAKITRSQDCTKFHAILRMQKAYGKLGI